MYENLRYVCLIERAEALPSLTLQFLVRSAGDLGSLFEVSHGVSVVGLFPSAAPFPLLSHPFKIWLFFLSLSLSLLPQVRRKMNKDDTPADPCMMRRSPALGGVLRPTGSRQRMEAQLSTRMDFQPTSTRSPRTCWRFRIKIRIKIRIRKK